jgi:S-adenosylmethionine:tRNA ribosyltransferase-isomerase
MKLSDFDFDLPEHLIATRPARPRTSARLLVAEGTRFRICMSDLVELLGAGDLLVLNNTKRHPGPADRAAPAHVRSGRGCGEGSR